MSKYGKTTVGQAGATVKVKYLAFLLELKYIFHISLIIKSVFNFNSVGFNEYEIKALYEAVAAFIRRYPKPLNFTVIANDLRSGAAWNPGPVPGASIFVSFSEILL